MTRYYTTSFLPSSKYGVIGDIVYNIYRLRWDAKAKSHSFVNISHYQLYSDNYDNTTSDVVFDSSEQEIEFLKYHPDSGILRNTVNRNGYYSVIQGFDSIPIEYRRGKWCWKKVPDPRI